MNTNQQVTDYRLSGFDIRSEMPLPELRVCPNPGGMPDLRFKLEPLPKTLSNPEWECPGLQLADSTALLTISGVARYLICLGRQISIHPDPSAQPRDVRLFLLGTAFGILCHQRGTFPLHASAVITQSGAMAFVGASGAGKSTLGAWLAQRGYPLLGDDICILEDQPHAPPLVQPGSPRIKLWSDALNALGIDPAGLQPDRTRTNKFHLEANQPPIIVGAALRHIYQLIDDDDAEPHIEGPAGQLDAIATIIDNTYRQELLAPLGLSEHHFRTSAALAQQVPVFRLCRPRSLKAMDAVTKTLKAHWDLTLPSKTGIQGHKL